MTKTEYRKYISSQEWQTRRKEYLFIYDVCRRCGLTRDEAVIAYDQDLHVHHRSYASLGDEADEDLESLCRRCHEMETFGRSILHRVKLTGCSYCGEETRNVATKMCADCRIVLRDLVNPMSLSVETKWGHAGERFLEATGVVMNRILREKAEAEGK